VPDNQPGDLIELDATGTDSKSKVTIAAPKGHTTNVTDIIIAGPIGTISAPTANILGDVSAGLVKSITLGTLSSSPTITLGGDAASVGSTIKLGRATGLALTSTGPIKSLTAIDWNGGSLTAPFITSFKVTGIKGTVAGDLSANITLTQNDAAKINLGTLSVAGAFSHSTLTSAGPVKAITVGSMNDSSVFIGTAGGVNALATSSADFVLKPATLTLASLTVKSTTQPGFVDSVIDAWNIGKLDLKTVTTANGGTALGAAADKIASVKFIAASVNSGKAVTLTTLDVPGDLDGSGVPAGDFKLNLL
jgi:hypothetical protein